ncbi:hypothetical protein [Spiroplasma diminutum]|uniref:Uncharacterized protein n=1 Tax=Spiroplasma diminutum CUAS-1 TaxID=1276221 RepID=S5MJ56_9MOLU|nr:hypothetical protein [Spiroplasma diminutum]AGR41990.1 hypothetical protein SDIMI_v3c02860 [Spiroplasma diminutum CUAS-1]
MIKTTFIEEDFVKYEDPKNIMMELFGVTCSVCGIEEIDFIDQKAPKTLGQVAQEILDENPEIDDEELNEMIEPQIEAWQELDDYNASIGMPTFLCYNCHDQLIEGEISISMNCEDTENN